MAPQLLPDSPVSSDTPQLVRSLKMRLLLALGIALVVSVGAFWSGYSTLVANTHHNPYYYSFYKKNFYVILNTTLVFGVVVFGVTLGILNGLKRKCFALSLVTLLVIAIAAFVVGVVMTWLHAQPPSNM